MKKLIKSKIKRPLVKKEFLQGCFIFKYLVSKT